jgi:two-component system phosphate regulon sensor histidine kinase PhoR
MDFVCRMWSSKLFRRVFLAFAVLIVISALAFGVLVSRGQETELRNQLIEQLRVSSVLLGEVAKAQVAGHVLTKGSLSTDQRRTLQELVRDLGERTETRLTLIGRDGTVLADSEQKFTEDLAMMDNHRHRPEVQEALARGDGYSQRYSTTLSEPLLYYAVRVDGDPQPIGVARSALPIDSIGMKVRRGRGMVALFAMTLAVVAIAGMSYLLSRIINPLLTLTRAVERMAAGHLGEHVEIANRDEIGMLARAFNRLNDDLLARIDQIRERGDQLAAVLGGMVEGVIAVDRRARILFANDAAGEQFDFQADQAHGRPLMSLIRDETLHQSVQRAMTTRTSVNAEIERHAPSSGTMAVHATPLPGEPCPGVVVVLYDMTQLRRLESMRQEFVANVSHELKTPLSSIKAYAETLRAGAINDHRHNLQFVQRIEDQADRLHQLILDLLSLARIESGEEAFEIVDVDMRDAVEMCLDEYRQSAEAKMISLRTEPPVDEVIVRADEEAVRQILENLVNNAIKYTPAEGEVVVRWKRERGYALIEVQDTGIGIEREHQERLFERFYRVDKARSRELGGTGLGLSIVKHLAQFFGGTVRVRSEVGKGSTFAVRLPLSD